MGMKTDGDSKFNRNNHINDVTLKSIMSYKTEGSHFYEFGYECKYNDIAFKFSSNEDYDPDSTPNVSVDAVTNTMYFSG
jgi:hypothetical protein